MVVLPHISWTKEDWSNLIVAECVQNWVQRECSLARRWSPSNGNVSIEFNPRLSTKPIPNDNRSWIHVPWYREIWFSKIGCTRIQHQPAMQFRNIRSAVTYIKGHVEFGGLERGSSYTWTSCFCCNILCGVAANPMKIGPGLSCEISWRVKDWGIHSGQRKVTLQAVEIGDLWC